MIRAHSVTDPKLAVPSLPFGWLVHGVHVLGMRTPDSDRGGSVGSERKHDVVRRMRQVAKDHRDAGGR
jgi:hypothetical protein